jgi:8-oxo-dGTP pyrophosphatase MutT (NUDIX family)
VTPPRTQPAVDVIEATELRLVEEAPPQLSAVHQVARDRVWDELAKANPFLFDGPVVACTSLDQSNPHELVLGWARVTYRNFALRRVPGARALPSLFVDVLQPTDDGALLVAQMPAATAHPGRWHLPGGSVEHPDADKPLDTTALPHNAARELLEELGIDTDPDELTPWALTRGDHGNMGWGRNTSETCHGLVSALVEASAGRLDRDR